CLPGHMEDGSADGLKSAVTRHVIIGSGKTFLRLSKDGPRRGGRGERETDVPYDCVGAVHFHARGQQRAIGLNRGINVYKHPSDQRREARGPLITGAAGRAYLERNLV